jgi:hypothetical protein
MIFAIDRRPSTPLPNARTAAVGVNLPLDMIYGTSGNSEYRCKSMCYVEVNALKAGWPSGAFFTCIPLIFDSFQTF